jgi:hypothetical protein
LVKYAKLGIILGLLGPSFREIEDEMRSQDAKGTEGKKKQGTKLDSSYKFVLREVSTAVFDLHYLRLFFVKN